MTNARLWHNGSNHSLIRACMWKKNTYVATKTFDLSKLVYPCPILTAAKHFLQFAPWRSASSETRCRSSPHKAEMWAPLVSITLCTDAADENREMRPSTSVG